jgi:hypothetical protein
MSPEQSPQLILKAQLARVLLRAYLDSTTNLAYWGDV